jgi:signal transduction histidine kinase
MTFFTHPAWRPFRILAVPLLLWALFGIVLIEPLQIWLRGDKRYDEDALVEWIEESRVTRKTLLETVREYLQLLDEVRLERPDVVPAEDPRLKAKMEEIEEFLHALGTPLTKMYAGQMPLFPVIYTLQVRFEESAQTPPIIWDSNLPRRSGHYQELPAPVPVRDLNNPARARAHVQILYQMHAYNKQQQNEQLASQRARWVLALAAAGTALSLLWVYLVQQREREQEERRLREALGRQDAERKHEEAERRLLEQSLEAERQAHRAADAEKQALELKSQLYASIGIMAGSYAHNIKNLLVRPNDLLARCLEADGVSSGQRQMLHEVRDTLGTVTERLQQILRTVRRDPGRAETARLDLGEVVADLVRTWQNLAREKWQLVLELEAEPGPLPVEGDLSHLQQAVENLLFNARDATFEMRNVHRRQAREAGGEQDRRRAVLAAAAWQGKVVVRTRREGDRAVLEVRDNGIGMTEEVRQRCIEAHFSTKRDNALYAGNTTGMGLGLSFVTMILDHFGATMAIESGPQRGATFRVSFPLAAGD